MVERTSFSSRSRRAVACARVGACAVIRTLIPSMPEARKASVTEPPRSNASSASIRPCSASASPDSLAPQVRSTRLTMTFSSPAAAMRARRSGRMPRSNISAIS